MKKKLKEKSISKLRKKAWRFFSEYIRKRDNYICFTCGARLTKATSQAGHFVHRNSMDFHERNVHCQCVHCNHFLSGNLIVYAIKLEKLYGYGIIEELKREGDKIKKWRVRELEEIIEKCKNYENKIR